MPIYEYQCSECGVHFEKRQRLGDPQPDACPNGHSQVRRILSQPAIIFKGSGFYATDHGRNGHGASSHKVEQKEKPETGESGNREAKPSEASAEVKPAREAITDSKAEKSADS